ncbi:9097_t:CDS:2 [Paraglomus brasilianum]|uniref:9097_t:CDS:1 n=1 Tax=Paraglomus brasilianum TaxID=144538 RepID=A0A9N8Z4B0_9GLOM|nr:9097_t:CDS:2 [Paraglomus brasilianum]
MSDIELIDILSRDFDVLLDDADDYNVAIYAGKESEMKVLGAHSVVLRARSSFFRQALSSEWAKKKDNLIVLKKPSISPDVFKIILRYIYNGRMSFDLVKDNATILDILIAAEELCLPELCDCIQDHLRSNNDEWLKKNFALVYRTAAFNDSFKKLQAYCDQIVQEFPELVFKANDFLDIDERVLLLLLKRSDIRMDEVDIWDHMLRWGISQTHNLERDISKWTHSDFTVLRTALYKIVPLINFSQMHSIDFYNKVKPFRRILPTDQYEDLLHYYLVPGNQLTSARLAPARTKSSIIDWRHAALISSWIDRKDENISTSGFTPYTSAGIPYEFRLFLRGSRDGFSTTIFHDRCDAQSHTVTIIKVRDSFEILGGYNPLPWKKQGFDEWQETSDSFLFSFCDDTLQNVLVSRVQEVTRAVHSMPSFGPSFGISDLQMKESAKDNFICTAKRMSYERPIRKNKEAFAIDDYEVFQVIAKKNPAPP